MRTDFRRIIVQIVVASANKWFRASNTGEFHCVGTTEFCPLCRVFNNKMFTTKTCDGCPVMEKTGYAGCHNTPFTDWSNMYRTAVRQGMTHDEGYLEDSKRLAFAFATWLMELAGEVDMSGETMWLVGRYGRGEGDQWDVMGLYSSEEEAVSKAARPGWFVGPVPVGEELPLEPGMWPGCYYPTQVGHKRKEG